MNHRQTSQRYEEWERSTIGTPDSAANLRLDSTMGAQTGASCPASCLCEDVCVGVRAREVKWRFVNKANCLFFFFCPYLSSRNRDKVQRVWVWEACRFFSGQGWEEMNSRDVSLFLAITCRGCVRQSRTVAVFVLGTMCFCFEFRRSEVTLHRLDWNWGYIKAKLKWSLG